MPRENPSSSCAPESRRRCLRRLLQGIAIWTTLALCACNLHRQPTLQHTKDQVERREQQREAMELANQTGQQDGELDAAMQLPVSPRHFSGPEFCREAYEEGYHEGYSRAQTVLSETRPDPRVLRQAHQHGFDLGLSDRARGLPPDYQRHQGRFDRDHEIPFAGGYRQAYPPESHP